MLSREAFSSAQMRGLEAHLDDSMDDLSALGLSAEEAFVIASRRLGAPGPLAAEFRKVGGESRGAGPGRWMLLGMVVYLGAAAVAQMLNVVGALIPVFLPRGWLAQLYPLLGCVGAAAAGVWFLRRSLRGHFRWLAGRAEGRFPVPAIGLLFFGTLVLLILIKSLVNILVQRFLIKEQLGHTPSFMWSLDNLANTAVVFSVLLALLWRYWLSYRRVLASA